MIGNILGIVFLLVALVIVSRGVAKTTKIPISQNWLWGGLAFVALLSIVGFFWGEKGTMWAAGVGLVIFFVIKFVPKETRTGLLKFFVWACAVGLVAFFVYAVVADIQGKKPPVVVVNPQAAQAVPAPEVVIDLVPNLMNQKGHIGSIFLPVCKAQEVIVTRTITVGSPSGQPVLLHFGAKNKGVAKLTMNPYRELEWKGIEFSQPGTSYVVLKAGTKVFFPPEEKPLIWFSLEKGKTGELAFSSEKVQFGYKELF